jgi:hypothetical protein
VSAVECGSVELPLFSARQRVILATAAILCAASRFLAVARSPRDWDEILFCFALRDYDIAEHHPHPPGYPLFIAMAKAARLFVDTDFHALQAITIVAGFLVFPAVFYFASTVGLRFFTSLSAAVLCAFFPAVWFFGGSAFSDVPSMVIVTFAAALLFRGRESRRCYWLGTLLLALAIGIRPQNLLVGLIPGLIASRRRRPLDVLVALGIGVITVAVVMGLAAQATGSVGRFVAAFRLQQDYVMKTDSFLNPDRPSLFSLAERFFLKPYGPTAISIVLSVFVLIALVRRSRALLPVLVTFGPFLLFAWLMLDRFQVPRYAIGYAPMLAILVASGIAEVSKRHESWVAGAIAAWLCVWTIPALTAVRRNDSPAVAAIEELRRVRPSPLFVGESMTAFVHYYLPEIPFERVIDARGFPLRWEGTPWLMADVTSRGGPPASPDAKRLWAIARRQFFAVSLQPVTSLPQFEGWSEDRVMSMRATTLLPSRGRGQMLLRLELGTQDARGATITIAVNGRVLESIVIDGDSLRRDYRLIPSESDRLELAVSPPRAIRLKALSWGPV